MWALQPCSGGKRPLGQWGWGPGCAQGQPWGELRAEMGPARAGKGRQGWGCRDALGQAAVRGRSSPRGVLWEERSHREWLTTSARAHPGGPRVSPLMDSPGPIWSCKTQLRKGRRCPVGVGDGKCLPVAWGWSDHCLSYVLGSVVGPVSCAESCPVPASARSSSSLLLSLHRGSWCPARTPSPTWHSTGGVLPTEGLANAVCAHPECVPEGLFPPTARPAPVQLVLGLAGEQDSSFCPVPRL